MAKDSVSGHTELKELAFSIYANEVKGKRAGFSGERVALESFRLAQEFLNIDAEIQTGGLSAERPPEPVAEFIEVDLWEQEGETWKPALDQYGRPVKERQLVDADAFAPNLPIEHPINQRAGQRAKEGWQEFRKAKAAAAS